MAGKLDTKKVYSVKSNARRDARKFGLDPDKAVKTARDGNGWVIRPPRSDAVNAEAEALAREASDPTGVPELARRGLKSATDAAANDHAKVRTPKAKAPAGGKTIKDSRTEPVAGTETATAPTRGAPRAGTVAEKVIELIGRPEGVTATELFALTSWKGPTLRGFISGDLRKRRGMNVVATRKDGETVYTFGAAPAAAK
jgi:hypothetical protein